MITQIQTRPVSEAESGLVARMRLRDQRALEDVYNRYSPLVLGIVRGRIADEHEAEAVLKKIFLRVWGQITSYDAQQYGLFTWILRITQETIREEKAKNTTAAEIQHIGNSVHPSMPATTSSSSALGLIVVHGFSREAAAQQLGISMIELQKRIRTEVSQYRKPTRDD